MEKREEPSGAPLKNKTHLLNPDLGVAVAVAPNLTSLVSADAVRMHRSTHVW